MNNKIEAKNDKYEVEEELEEVKNSSEEDSTLNVNPINNSTASNPMSIANNCE